MLHEKRDRFLVPFEDVQCLQLMQVHPTYLLKHSVDRLAGERANNMIKDPEGAVLLRIVNSIRIDPFLPEKFLPDLGPDIQFLMEFTGECLGRSFPLFDLPSRELPFQGVACIRAALTGKDLISFGDNAYGNFLHDIKIRKKRKKLKAAMQKRNTEDSEHSKGHRGKIRSLGIWNRTRGDFRKCWGRYLLQDLTPPVDHPVDTLFEPDDIEVDQEPKMFPGKSEERQELGLMQRNDGFHSFEFDYDFVLYRNIND